MVVADADALGRVLLDAAGALRDALPDRLGRLVPGAARRRMKADAFGRAVVDRHEHRDLAVLGCERGGPVGAPHGVDRLGDDGAVVVAGPAGRARPGRGREAVLPHQAACALLRAAQALMAQPRPDLAMALAREGAGDEHWPDRLHQGRIAIGPRGSGRRRGADGMTVALRPRWRPARGTSHTRAARAARAARATPWRRRVEIEATGLVASISAARKGRRRSQPRAARSWRKAAPYPGSARRPWFATGRSSRPGRPALATSGPRRPRSWNASRQPPTSAAVTGSSRATIGRRLASQHPQTRVAPGAPPSSAAPGPEPQTLRSPRSPRPRLLRASHP